jgi:hypothetical protein
MWSRVESVPRWIDPLLVATIALNLFDLVATLIFVGGGHAVEANPIMARALEIGPHAFVVLKLALVAVGVYVLWRFAWHSFAQAGSVVVCAAYTALAGYHLSFLHVLIA